MRNFRISNQLDDLVFSVPKFPTNLAIGVAKVEKVISLTSEITE
jgi:hypothetical protein